VTLDLLDGVGSLASLAYDAIGARDDRRRRQ